MNKKGLVFAIIVIGVIVVIGGLAYFGFKNLTSEVASDNEAEPIEFDDAGEVVIDIGDPEPLSDNSGTLGDYVIEFVDGEYVPNTVTLSAGESVTFVNKYTKNTWPASDIHPTHTVYPGSSKSKCGTSEESMIFDSCRGLKMGESYTFVFNEIGEWRFHDHLSAGKTGTIIVK